MRVGNFGVLIRECVRERDNGHVLMRPNTVYTIKVCNYGHTRAEADVKVDGKSMGTFRLEAHWYMDLEGPPGDGGRFTFYAVDSLEGQLAGAAQVATTDRGLVEVTFRPERYPAFKASPTPSWIKQPSVSWTFSSSGIHNTPVNTLFTTQNVSAPEAGGIVRGLSCSAAKTPPASYDNLTPGVTGLSGHTDQKFHDVPALDTDPFNTVVITVRLVAAPDEPAVRPLSPVPPRGNPVPPPVG